MPPWSYFNFSLLAISFMLLPAIITAFACLFDLSSLIFFSSFANLIILSSIAPKYSPLTLLTALIFFDKFRLACGS